MFLLLFKRFKWCLSMDNKLLNRNVHVIRRHINFNKMNRLTFTRPIKYAIANTGYWVLSEQWAMSVIIYQQLANAKYAGMNFFWLIISFDSIQQLLLEFVFGMTMAVWLLFINTYKLPKFQANNKFKLTREIAFLAHRSTLNA